jgi:Phage terminase large subunit gpA, ATPase domain
MDLIAQAFHDACIAPDDREIYEWAADHVTLSVGGYAIPGLFKVEKSRQLLAPFQALHNLTTRIVSVRAAIQGAKSLLSDCWIPNTLANCPGPTLLTMQTDRIAGEHAEVRLMPIIRECQPLKRLMPESRHKTRTTEIIFKNTVPLYVRGPALGNAQSKSIRYVSIDEAWLLALEHPGRIREFMARTSKYDEIGNSKTLVTSQGSEVVKDPEGVIIGDDFAKLWHQGNQGWWTVHCLTCQHRFIPLWTIPLTGGEFAGMKWDSNGSQVRYECPSCRQAMIDSDATKAAWNAAGSYTIKNPQATEHESFTWPAWISAKWEPLVQEFLGAMQAKRAGLLMPLKIFIQKKCGDDWQEKLQLALEEASIITGEFEAGPKREWTEEKYRFLSVDCQANLLLFYVVIRAWASNGESRRIFRGRFNTFEAVRDCQVKFGVPAKFVGVDSGYEATKVYRQCCRHVEVNGRGWAAFAATDQDFFTHTFAATVVNGMKVPRTEKRIYSEMQRGDPLMGARNEDARRWLDSVSPHAARLYQQGLLKCPIYLWSRPSVNDILQGLLDGKGAPFISPAGEAQEAEEKIYRQHLAGTVKKMKRDKRGIEKMVWVDIAPQHYRSCEEIQVAQASLAGVVNPEKLTFLSAAETPK